MTPEIGVGAVIYRQDTTHGRGEILLVQRAHSPGQGLWALPGGHLMWGESLTGALQREITEELHITIHIGQLIYVAELLGPSHHLVILDYAATVARGQPTVGSDARDYRWVSALEIKSLSLAPGMEAFLASPKVRSTLQWG